MSIYALVATASHSQAMALRDAIYKHLTFKAYAGLSITVSL